VSARCCGLDVPKRTVVACLVVPGAAGQPHQELRTFETLTDDLLTLADGLVEPGGTHAAMEATGVSWKPIWNLLEGSALPLLLVNARPSKAGPGRKTDGHDGAWLADLLRHGLRRGSFVPDRPQRELRELTRDRTSLGRERRAAVKRRQQVLEGANRKRASVATTIMGKSWHEMLAALVDGFTDPMALAQLAKGRLREKIPAWERALVGRFGAHQRFLITPQLAPSDALDETIERVSAEVAERVRPFEEETARLDTIPGIDRRGAATLVAEVGVDPGRFPSADHLAAGAGLVPGNNASAGKRRSGTTHKGNPWRRAFLVEAAYGAGRTQDTYLGAQDRRLAARRGRKRAAVAVGHSILVIASHLLRREVASQDLGPHDFDERDREGIKRRLVRRLEDLGFQVTVEPAPAA
jgi:transposase